MNFINTILQVGNMRKAQEFVHYPYDGTEFLNLQSDKRWIKLNIKTGHGEVTNKNGQNTSWHMMNGTINFQLDETQLLKIQAIYIINDGENGKSKCNTLTWTNEKLFSQVETA